MAAVFRSNLPTVLITGANRGMGLGLAKEYAKNGFNVLGTSRSVQNQDIQEVSPFAAAVYPLDVSDPKSIQSLISHIQTKTPCLDIVINNAGIMIPDKIGSLTADSLIKQFKVNTVGPSLLIQHAMPLLRASPRVKDRAISGKVVNMSAILASLKCNVMCGKLPGYRTSKTAQNALTLAMASECKDITFLAIHPGFVRTRMSANKGEISVEESAKLLFQIISNAQAPDSGKFLNQLGIEIPW